MEPSLRVSLKGLNQTRGHEGFYTSSAPYDEGKILHLVVMELLGFRRPGSESALPGSRVVVCCPQTAAESSLYIHRLTPAGSQSPEAGS